MQKNNNMEILKIILEIVDDAWFNAEDSSDFGPELIRRLKKVISDLEDKNDKKTMPTLQ